MEAWIPAFAGTAREAHIKIVTMLVDTNWITAAKTGIQGAEIQAAALDPRFRGGDEYELMRLDPCSVRHSS